MRYLLDTNICIYIIKRQSPEVLRRLESLPLGSAVMSVVSYAELRAGLEMQTAHRAQEDRVLALLIQRIPVLPFGESDAISFGVLRAAVRDRRRDTMNQLIAAHATGLGLTLVTHNETDFQGYPGLMVENWVNSP
ncbi:type II toxin-antitoxin system VapC family toxin [Rhodoferax sp.]|uniref:type II toxin-antitoxin system VapC family toxin n=1 Tax=Rhodoferax sp. TaxID=50421 RepID=UPI00262845FF|nr:type II toxin-antitoxin system VapC family toxin [Rhodoferax sp.]MDD2808823.1 type II toxin-antitoxin system VapC family toxin [Rhodoferax sp.]MDD4942629.1 type II toxin-antitoxin system VapC family toxin [Rhodoferax sp.]